MYTTLFFSFFLPREIIFYKKKNKKSVSGDNKYLKLDLFHVSNHPHTQRLFVTGKNDRIFGKKYLSNDVSLAEKLSNAKSEWAST